MLRFINDAMCSFLILYSHFIHVRERKKDSFDCMPFNGDENQFVVNPFVFLSRVSSSKKRDSRERRQIDEGSKRRDHENKDRNEAFSLLLDKKKKLMCTQKLDCNFRCLILLIESFPDGHSICREYSENKLILE